MINRNTVKTAAARRKLARACKLACALVCAATLTALPGCQKPAAKDSVVKVGKTTVGNESFNAFKKAARIYPAPLPHYFPGQRQPATFMAECEAIYQTTKSSGIGEKISSSHDWEWKKRYFAAAPFFDLLENLGFTDAQLEEYYKNNTETFRTISYDDDGKEQSTVAPFENVKRAIADKLFGEKYQPDSAFIASLKAENLGVQYDSAIVLSQWLYQVRSNPAEFFMRQFYREQTGETYNDFQQIYGDGKPIVPDDIEIIRSWVPENRRNMRMEDLVEWLYKWKTFAEHAEKMGLTATQEHKDMIHWASRIEHANAYLQQEILPKFENAADISESDSSLALLAIYDQFGFADDPGELRLRDELTNISRARTSAKIDSVIYNIRKNAKITFLQDEYKDERDANPVTLLAKADSLRDLAADDELDDNSSLLDEAEKAYRTLMTDFAFTVEGRKAMTELAKLQIDKYNSGPHPERFLLSSAINAYRRAQILDKSEEIQCNSYFMVGFTYDEYLKNFPLAEANYKWILLHSPGCALVSDAEFMLLHLDEPMSSIEEIQGQSMRQGRKIDFDDEIAIDDDFDNSAPRTIDVGTNTPTVETL
jgi:hypothetical protein